MTNAEIMAQILHEVTGKPKEQMLDTISAVRQVLGEAGYGFDRVVPQEEVARSLARLRKEKSGILTWLVEGSIETSAWVDSMNDKNKEAS